MKGKDSAHFCFLGEWKKKIAREKKQTMRHTHSQSENGGQCTSNITGYFGTEPLSAPLSMVLLPFSGASYR